MYQFCFPLSNISIVRKGAFNLMPSVLSQTGLPQEKFSKLGTNK